MDKNVIKRVIDSLEQRYPKAAAELNFSTAFELLIAVILSAQCTDKRVNAVTGELFKKYNKPEHFATMSVLELESFIYTCGLGKQKARGIIESSKIILEKHLGQVPNDIKQLLLLPSVGIKTASVVASVAFNIPAIAVDTHVFRVSNRIGIVTEKNVEKTKVSLEKAIPKDRWIKSHHLLIFHGRYTCKARNPMCEICNLTSDCKYYKQLLK